MFRKKRRNKKILIRGRACFFSYFIGKSEYLPIILARYCRHIVNGKVIVWVWVSASGRYERYDIKR